MTKRAFGAVVETVVTREEAPPPIRAVADEVEELGRQEREARVRRPVALARGPPFLERTEDRAYHDRRAAREHDRVRPHAHELRDDRPRVLREPEVGELHGAARGHHQVARLHVAMHDAASVRERERARAGEDDPEREGRARQVVCPPREVLARERARVHAREPLHDDAGEALALVVDPREVEHGDHVRMVEERRGRLGLALEELRGRRIVLDLRRARALERHVATEHAVLGDPNLAEPAVRGAAEELVPIGDDAARCEQRGQRSM
jgi:hypothetical protein